MSDAIVDIADGPFGSNLKTEHYTDEKEARIIQLSNLSDYGWQEPNTRYTTFEHAKEIRRCIVNEGELVMGKMMPAGMTIIRPNTEKMYVLSSDCVRIKLDKNVATDEFFLYTTKSETFLNQVNNDSQGSTRVRTSISKIREMDFATPSLEEQAKIGEYFTNLDNLITLHQRKQSCNTLLINVWEQRKFGDVGSVAMCKRIFKEQTSEEGDVPFYKIGTFGGSPDAYISRELFEEYKKAYQYPSKGDILISASGSIGRTVEYTGEDEYFQDSNIVWLKHGDNIDNAFLKVLYSVVEWSCEGSTIKRLYNDIFLKTEFMLPYIEEQTKIGEFFSQIDNLITLHRRAYHYTKRRTYK